MDAKLVVIGGKANMGEVKLRLPMTIGRGSKADLIISHPTVSREHCKLSEVKGELLVTDNGSSNGTFVDGEKIEAPTIVRSGQILAIGPLTFRAEYEAPSAGKKKKAPQPHESGLAETQAVDRDELDIDFILDDLPAPTVETKPAQKKKQSAPTIEAKAPDVGKKAAAPAKPEAKKEAAAKAPAPAKDAPKGKAPVAPKGPETDEMDLDFLMDEIAEEKKKAPASRDTDEIDFNDFSDLDEAAPEAKKKGDDLTSEFRSAPAEPTVDFKSGDVEFDDSFFEEVKPEATAEEKPAAPAKSKPEAPATKDPAAPEAKAAPKEKPADAKAPKIEPPAAVEPPAPAAKSKKGGGMDFDFLAAGPAAEPASPPSFGPPSFGPPKQEVSFDDIASEFDFSGTAKAKPPEKVEQPKVEEPVAKGPEVDDISIDDGLIEDGLIEDAAAEEKIELPAFEPPAVESPVAKDEQQLFDDFLDEELSPDAKAATPADEPVAESAPFEAREEELVWEKSPTPEETALDDILVEETLAAPEAKEPEAKLPEVAPPAAVAAAEEFPFSVPVTPPAASELPAMPEMKSDEPAPAAEAPAAEADDFLLDDGPFHEAADAAAVAPADRAETFAFDAPPAEVPVFDAASESMTLDDAIAAETPAPTKEEPAAQWPAVSEESVQEEAVAETKADAATDFDFLSELDDAPAPVAESPVAEEAVADDWSIEATNSAAADVKPMTGGELADIALDLDEVPAAPAPSFDVSAMNETQDIDLRSKSEENLLDAPTIEIKGPAPAVEAKSTSPFDFSGLEAKKPTPAIEPPATAAPAAAAADDFDFLSDEPAAAPVAAAPAEDKTEAFDFGADWKPAAAEAPAMPSEEAPATADDLFGDFTPTPEAAAALPDVAPPEAPTPQGSAPSADDFAIGSSAGPAALKPSAGKSDAKPAKPAAKLSIFDKIKMLFSGSAKAKPSKAKKPADTTDVPKAKLPPVAPPKPALDPIPLDDGPIGFGPSSAASTSAAPSQDEGMPSFDFESESPSAAAASTDTFAVGSSWKPSEAPIPLDESPISFDIETPPAAAATDSITTQWNALGSAPASTSDPVAAAESPTPEAAPAAVDEFDLFGNDLLDESANPEAAAAAAAAEAQAKGADESPSFDLDLEATKDAEPVAEWSVVESPIAEAPVAEELGVAEKPIKEEDFWLDDLAPTPTTEAPAVEAPTPTEAAATEPTFDFEPEPIAEAAASPNEIESLGLADDFSLTEAAAPESPAPAQPSVADTDSTMAWSLEAEAAPTPEAKADAAELKTAEPEMSWLDEPAATAEPTPTADLEQPEAKQPATESLDVSAAADDIWSFDQPEAAAPNAPPADAAKSEFASIETPAAESPALEAGAFHWDSPVTSAPDASAESPAVEEAAAPPTPTLPPAAPVTSRARSVDVDLRLGSSLRSLTRVTMRPPRIDVASMEPETPAGRSFEPRAKSAPVPNVEAAAAPSPTLDEMSAPPSAETPAADFDFGIGTGSAEDAPAAESAPFSFGDSWNEPAAPSEAASNDASPSDAALGAWLDETPAAFANEAAPTASASAPNVVDDEFSLFDDVPTAEVSPAGVESAAETPVAPKADTEAGDDRTVAYLGSPQVVEEAESCLAARDDSARTAPEPSFDLDSMLAEADRANPPEAPAAPAESEPAAADELSFLTLSDDVDVAPSKEEAAAPAAEPSVAHVPSNELDLGFLDVVDVTEAPADEFLDFRFDDPKTPAAKTGLEKTETQKVDAAKPEAVKNGAKPQPAAAQNNAAQNSDDELADFLRDLGMN